MKFFKKENLDKMERFDLILKLQNQRSALIILGLGKGQFEKILDEYIELVTYYDRRFATNYVYA